MSRSLAVSIALVLVLCGGAPQGADAQCLVGEVVFWGGSFAPTNWLPVDGSTRLVAEFQQLAGVLSNRYGGDGTTTFGLPDLRGRTPLGTGQGIGLTNRPSGPLGGAETVTLTPQQLPAHSHPAIASGNIASSTDPHNNLWAAQSRTPLFGSAGNLVPMSPSAITSAGGDQPHDNMSPFLTLTPIICASGTTPLQRTTP